jgi:hypothetical protein
MCKRARGITAGRSTLGLVLTLVLVGAAAGVMLGVAGCESLSSDTVSTTTTGQTGSEEVRTRRGRLGTAMALWTIRR